MRSEKPGSFLSRLCKLVGLCQQDSRMNTNDSSKHSAETRRQILAREAISWVGVKETPENKGEIVEMFQRYVGTAQGEPWCMSFVQFCVGRVDGLCKGAWPEWEPSQIFQSEHCLTVWEQTPLSHRLKEPVPGAIVIWRHGETRAGHTGIVTKVRKVGMETVEGNTSARDSVDREGQGVMQKVRSVEGQGSMKVVGFLSPWI